MEKTRTCEMFVDELGILHVKILPNVIIDIEDAADNFLLAKSLTNDKKILKLVDARNSFKIEKKAQVFIQKENDPDKNIARAVIVNSFIEKYLQEFFMSLDNSIPVKIFTSEKKAIEWLKTFL